MAEYFDRYNDFKSNGIVKPMPGLFIEQLSTDKLITYNLGRTRLDIVSQQYYTNPYYGWLIMLANPRFGGLEYSIPNGTVIRIPFPLNSGLQRYQDAINKHFTLYGY